MKTKLRKVCVNEQLWGWIYLPKTNLIKIYSPQRKEFKIKATSLNVDLNLDWEQLMFTLNVALKKYIFYEILKFPKQNEYVDRA